MKHRLWRILMVAALALVALDAQAQLDYSAYGVVDFSYGRFEASGTDREHRFNSNSLTATFVGVNAKYGLEGGWTPGITLETFVRLQDFQTGRRDSDPLLSREAFVSLAQRDLGTLRVGRLQTLLFKTTARFNALGSSGAFSPAIRHLFGSGNLDGVQGDFYWNRAVSYVSPDWDGVTAQLMYGRGPIGKAGDLAGATVVVSRGLFAAALSAQRVHVNDGFTDPTRESAWQLAASYTFGFARVFGMHTRTRDQGLDVHSRSTSVGVDVPLGPGTVQAQMGYTTASGPAVDRRHTSVSAAYLYPYDSLTDLYLVGMDDRVRGQTEGVSVAAGVRFRF